MSPLVEQHDSTFLCYVKEKVKILQTTDNHVGLLIDEIHLQQFFDYKGGNVVGAASNSKEAAKSAFAFMITSILSKYKDVVHVLPTCKLDGKDLYILIQRTVWGLEKVGFHVISVITDNNAINRKQHHSLLSHLNFLCDTSILAIELVPCFSCFIPCTFWSVLGINGLAKSLPEHVWCTLPY